MRRGDRSLVFTPDALRAAERDTQGWLQFETTEYLLDEDVRELDLVVGGCERLFSSPVPPTMSRHTLRSLALWLLALPFALKGTMAPGTVAMSAFATAYVYVGIEELGVQVEQPFELIPMTRICAIVTANVEEAFSAPPDTK